MMRSLHSIVCLLITGLPIICANHPISLTASEMQFASVNNSVILWCNLTHKHHLPENAKIEWFDGPLPIKTALNGITITFTKTNTKLESQMIIDTVENFHFGQYNCQSTGNRGQLLAANTSLLPRGTNNDGKNLITNINLTHPGQVPLKCNNVAPGNNNVSWKKVQFNQTVVSLDEKTDSFNASISSLSETGKFVCYDNNTIFQISYVYPQDYHSLSFTENLPDNVTLVFNNTNSILLTCTVPSLTKHTKLYWVFNNETLASDVVKRVHIPTVIKTDSGYQLQLIITSPIPKKDAGTYTCVAANEWEKIERHFNINFDIKTDDPFTITSFSSQQCMIDGAEFTASCVIRLNKGTTPPQVFMLYSNTISSNPTQLMEDTNTHLQLTVDTTNHIVTKTITIKSASVKNNGTYYCIALLNFDSEPVMQKMTTEFIKRPVEIVKYYKDPIEKHSITCKAHVLANLFMNSTTIKFTHHINHGHNVMYDPTTIAINTTDKSITAHLDLNSIHDHRRYHGVYICTTSASLLDKPDKIYSDSRDLTVEHTSTKKHTASVMAFSVQSTESDQSSNHTPTTETVYIVAGVTVVVVATAVLVFAVVHQRLRRSKHSLLNQPQYV